MVKTNQPEKMYLSLGEVKEIHSILANTFNLKVDIIDEIQEHFSITSSKGDVVTIEGQKITITNYGETTVTVTHIETGINTEFTIKVVVKIESLVQGFRDMDLSDGEYEVSINDQIYIVELINIYDDMRYSLDEGQTSKTISLGDNTTEYKTLVVKYHGDLTIDEGVTLTATTVNGLTYKKGMYLCVLGNIYNNGEISMTARGTYNTAGENVWLWKNIDNSYEYVPALGAEGGALQSTSTKSKVLNGNKGNAGIGRQTGGGGTGAGRNYTKSITIGAGGRGTSYSGGSGSGAANSDGSSGGNAVSAAGSSIRRSRK